jgi:hypothetical protein
MKETKIYQDPEHKNHRQLLKKCTLQCAIYSTGVYKPMGISGDTLREALLAVRKYTETLQKKSRVKRTIICY